MGYSVCDNGQIMGSVEVFVARTSVRLETAKWSVGAIRGVGEVPGGVGERVDNVTGETKATGMATLLNFDAFREPPSYWVDHAASDTSPEVPARGWLRDLAGLAEALYADDLGPPDAARIRWLCEKTREFAEDVGGKMAFVLRLGVFATTWVAPVMILRAPPLWRLPVSERVRALIRYESSPLGLTLFAVKGCLGINWFEHPGVARDAHFDGQCRGERT